jgi:carboxyl-terminal processing protease
MSDNADTEQERDRRVPRYLPYLTWTLLLLLFAWFLVWWFHYRPTEPEQKRLAAFRRVMRVIPAAYIYEVDQAELYHAAMHGMVASLEDKYSAYIPPRETNRIHEETEGEFGGIGVRVTAGDGEPVIVEVEDGGPAKRAGVQAGDVIARVGEEPTAGLTLNDVVDRIRGKVGTTVDLALRRTAEETINVTLERERITFANVTWRMLEDGLALLQVRSFDKNCSEEVEEALREILQEDAEGLVLDVRGNPGGLMDQALRMSDLFLAGGEIVTLRSRERSVKREADTSVALPADVPVVILVDDGTGSAAEILAGSLQANGRAVVVGTSTRGKGSVTELIDLRDGSAINLTIGRYVLSGGRLVEGRGIKPDVVAGRLPPRPRDGVENEREWLEKYEQSKQQQLTRAVQILKEKLAAP